MEVLGASQNILLERSSQKGPSKQWGCCGPLPQPSGKDGSTCKAVSAQLLMTKIPVQSTECWELRRRGCGEGGEWDGDSSLSVDSVYERS